MEEVERKKLLTALLDLRLALGELQASLMDIDKCIRELMAVELDIKKAGDERDRSSSPP